MRSSSLLRHCLDTLSLVLSCVQVLSAFMQTGKSGHKIIAKQYHREAGRLEVVRYV